MKEAPAQVLLLWISKISKFHTIPIFQSFIGLCLKKRCLRNLAKFTGKQLCQSLFFNKADGLKPGTILKKTLAHVYFSEFLQHFYNRLIKRTSTNGCVWKLAIFHFFVGFHDKWRKDITKKKTFKFAAVK